MTVTVTSTPAASAQNQAGPAPSSAIPVPTATRSAVTCSAFAAMSATSSTPITVRGSGRRHLAVASSPQALTGGQRGPVADLLHGCHEREGDPRRPQQGEALRGTRLGVGRDARGVVVAGAGDQTGPQRAQVIAPAPALVCRGEVDMAPLEVL